MQRNLVFIVWNWDHQDFTERSRLPGNEEQAEKAGLLFAQRVTVPIWNYLGVSPLWGSPLPFTCQNILSISQILRRYPFPRCNAHCLSLHSVVMLWGPYLWGSMGNALRQGSRGGLCLLGCQSFWFCQSEGSGGCGFEVRSFGPYSGRGWDGWRPAPRRHLERSLGYCIRRGCFKTRLRP